MGQGVAGRAKLGEPGRAHFACESFGLGHGPAVPIPNCGERAEVDGTQPTPQLIPGS